MRRLYDTARKRVVLLSLACWVAICAVIIAVGVPYVRLSPGPMFDVLGSKDGTQIISISGAREYPTEGQLDMTTVSERGGPYGDLTLIEAFTGWLKSDVSVVPTSLLYPQDESADAAADAGADQFVDSQEKARIAALEEVGKPVVTYPWIVDVGADSPATSVLQHGDVVLSVDGHRVDGPHQVAKRVQAAGPDADVRMDIRRGDADSTVSVRTVANPHNPDKGYIGVTVGVMADSPVKVKFHLDDVGGPSAGLIFALGAVDKLSAGDLLGGRRIAGTGTMDYDGSVGPIGGIGQKMAAAQAAGVELFLAPADNCDEVRAAAPPGLRIAAVKSLHQAVRVLKGDAPPKDCSALAG